MPASSARFTGSLKACWSTSATAMASAFAAIAELTALTISAAIELAEPVHCVVQPVSAAASRMPYWVAVKNGLVVTWLTNTMRQPGCERPAARAGTMPPIVARAEPRAAPLRTRRRSKSWSDMGVPLTFLPGLRPADPVPHTASGRSSARLAERWWWGRRGAAAGAPGGGPRWLDLLAWEGGGGRRDGLNLKLQRPFKLGVRSRAR